MIRVGAVGAILDGDKILLMLRAKEPAKGFWAIPGGKIEMFETAEQCLVREVKEELDVEVRVTKFLGNIQDINKEKNIHWIMPAFLLNVVSGKIKNLEPEKHLEIKWEKIKEIDPAKMSYMTNQVLNIIKSEGI